MQWDKLLSSVRYGQEERGQQYMEWRSPFQVDYDRIVFLEAFRTLQGKTQVVPMPKDAFVHTRLTHSMETASVGRSLGNMVGQGVMEMEKDLRRHDTASPYDFGSLVSAACLAHDLGNPPFGHSGEAAISDFFKSTQGEELLDGLTEAQTADLQNFEGNAAGFRMLVHNYRDLKEFEGGLNLTYATLATFAKYPKGSLPDLKKKKGWKAGASEKKYGYFQDQQNVFTNVATHTGLIPAAQENCWRRHPLAFLMEAADDICYHIIDLEDGYKLKLITFEEIYGLLSPFLKDENDRERCARIGDDREQVGYLRAKAIGKLIKECVQGFITHYDAIMEGRFDRSLTEIIPSSGLMGKIMDISKDRIYSSGYVLEVEVSGMAVLGGLLGLFAPAVAKPADSLTGHQKSLRKLVPPKYLLKDVSTPQQRYLQLLNLTEYITSMTDMFAVNLYKKLNLI